jgi:hypothetical protein
LSTLIAVVSVAVLAMTAACSRHDAAQYRDDSAKRSGRLMMVVSPSQPPPGLAAECTAYGSSVLILRYARLDPVHVNASLCTQGEINQAVLYATLSVMGTHAAVWMGRE